MTHPETSGLPKVQNRQSRPVISKRRTLRLQHDETRLPAQIALLVAATDVPGYDTEGVFVTKRENCFS